LTIAEEARNLHQWLPVLRLARSQDESMAINKITGGAVIIAGSGMCTGGRIRHHLKYNLWRAEAQVIIVGYQARGTLGRALVDGAKQVHLLGNEIAVKARLHTLGGFSAHAGQSQLIDWFSGFVRPRPRTYLVHGEPEKCQALADKIARRTGVTAILPREEEIIEL
jgi:metallo-beta-lactamase family protein